MDLATLYAALPDVLCIVVCVVGCICSGRSNGSVKKMLEKLCPSVEPVQALEARVAVLENQLASLLEALKGVQHGDDD